MTPGTIVERIKTITKVVARWWWIRGRKIVVTIDAGDSG
jgi:hypothetical protein